MGEGRCMRRRDGGGVPKLQSPIFSGHLKPQSRFGDNLLGMRVNLGTNYLKLEFWGQITWKSLFWGQITCNESLGTYYLKVELIWGQIT